MARIPDSARKAIRARANGRCEYCRLPDGTGLYPFHVEHIISRKHGGTSQMDNLAWACFSCNIAKGSDIASYDATSDQLASVFNPRKHKWDDHFELDGGYIIGKTPEGRITVRLLKMNRDELVAIREELI